MKILSVLLLFIFFETNAQNPILTYEASRDSNEYIAELRNINDL
ncbi:MAG: hypothetical protein AAF573_07980 [Bacteroidota bacterium]